LSTPNMPGQRHNPASAANGKRGGRPRTVGPAVIISTALAAEDYEYVLSVCGERDISKSELLRELVRKARAESLIV
jgi:hypothetical protein